MRTLPPYADVVIVGAGSAGSALANRLSADPARRVLVLDAGREDWLFDPLIHLPAALPFPIKNPLYVSATIITGAQMFPLGMIAITETDARTSGHA